MTCNKWGIPLTAVNHFIELCLPNTATSKSITSTDCVLQAADVGLLGNFNLQALFHLVPLLLQASSHLVPFLFQALFHSFASVTPTLFSFFVKTFLLYLSLVIF